MKKFFLLATLCYAGTFSIAQPSKEEKNKEAVIASFNAMQKGDLNTAFKDYDNTIMVSGNGGAKPISLGLDSLKIYTTANRADWTKAFPDVNQQLVAVAADGNYVMLYTKSSGTWKNNFTIWQPSGKSYQMSDVSIYKFNDDGKITEVQRIMPMIAVMDQVGEGGEFDINKAGYALLAQKKYKEAIEIFKLNVKLYPKSSNVYDSLGEAYMVSGDKKNAIENYEKSIQLDPENTNGKGMLAKLRQ